MSFIREVRKDIELEAIRLMREYRANLIVEAKRLCRDDSVAEDLAMKTIEVYMSKPEEELPPAEKSLAYLKSILKNIYRDSVRGKAQACIVYLDPEDMERIDELEQVDNSTEEAILAHSDAEMVRNAIARLPESARSAIVMHYFESLSISQIAELLKKSPDSVKSNLYYARKVLAKRLAKALGRTSAVVIALLLAALGYAAVTFTGVFTPSEPPDAVAAEQTAAETAADGPLAAAETRAPGPFSAQYAGLSALASTNEQDDSAIEQQIIEKEQSMNTNTYTKVLAATSLAASLAASPMALASSTARYIQDGLVAHWDGVENAGRGVHDPSATVWKDLVAGYEFNLNNVVVDADRMTFSGTISDGLINSYGVLSASDTESTFVAAKNGTMEVVFRSSSGAASQVFLQAPATSGIAFGIWETSKILNFSSVSSVNKAAFTFTSGTATNSVSVRYDACAPVSALANGLALDASSDKSYWSYPNDETQTFIGARASRKNNPFAGSIYCIRLYNRRLTDDEIAANQSVDRKRFIEGNTSVFDCELIDVSTNAAKVVWEADTPAPSQLTARFVSGFAPDLSDGVALQLGSFASGTVVTSAVAFARASSTYWRIEAEDEGGGSYSSPIDMVPAFAGEDLSTAPLQVKYDGPGASYRSGNDYWPVSGERFSRSVAHAVENGGSVSICVGWTLFAETGDDVWEEESHGTTCEVSYLEDGRRRRLVWHTALSQNLPGGYVRLESIDANGQQLIDTGYSPNYMTHATLDLQFDGTYILNATSAFFGASDSGDPDHLIFSCNFGSGSGRDLYFWTQKSYTGGAGTMNMVVPEDVVKARNTLDIDMEAGIANYGGNTRSVSKRTASQTQPETVKLFGRDNSFNAYPTMRIFGAAFADGSTLRRDFVPAQSLDTGRRGLYDLVDGNFYTNIVENGADFDGTVCGLHVDGEPERLGEPTIPYGCNLVDDGTEFELAEPNFVNVTNGKVFVKSIARYSFNATTCQWEFSGRTPGSKVAATYTGEPVKYVLEWRPGGTGFFFIVH